jgi:hypothetical protein
MAIRRPKRRGRDPGGRDVPACPRDRYGPDAGADAQRLRLVRGEVYADWESVYRDNVSLVFRVMFSRVGNRMDAEDLTTEVFLAALGPLRTTATMPCARRPVVRHRPRSRRARTMGSDALWRYVEALLRSRRPRPFRTRPQDPEVLRTAITLRAARPGSDVPREEFVGALHARLAREMGEVKTGARAMAERRTGRTRRRVVQGAALVAASAVGVVVGRSLDGGTTGPTSKGVRPRRRCSRIEGSGGRSRPAPTSPAVRCAASRPGPCPASCRGGRAAAGGLRGVHPSRLCARSGPGGPAARLPVSPLRLRRHRRSPAPPTPHPSRGVAADRGARDRRTGAGVRAAAIGCNPTPYSRVRPAQRGACRVRRRGGPMTGESDAHTESRTPDRPAWTGDRDGGGHACPARRMRLATGRRERVRAGRALCDARLRRTRGEWYSAGRGRR